MPPADHRDRQAPRDPAGRRLESDRRILLSRPAHRPAHEGILHDRADRAVPLDCERAGINAHQFSSAANTAEVLRTVRERGSKMQFICLDAGRAGIKAMVEATRPIAMVHHGGVTDTLFREGKSGEVHDYVKAAHDQGVLAGVSAHNPDCIKRIADEGWEVDFFMTCFHFLTRDHGGARCRRLEIAYPFYADDPAAMTAVVRQVKQPCLGFKILAAGPEVRERTIGPRGLPLRLPAHQADRRRDRRHVPAVLRRNPRQRQVHPRVRRRGFRLNDRVLPGANRRCITSLDAREGDAGRRPIARTHCAAKARVGRRCDCPLVLLRGRRRMFTN